MRIILIENMLNFANLSDLEEVNKKFGYGFSKGQFGKPIVQE